MIDGSRGPRTATREVVRFQVDGLATRWTSKEWNYDASMEHLSLHAGDAGQTSTGLNQFAGKWETEEGQRRGSRGWN